jgi:hypothetical protein
MMETSFWRHTASLLLLAVLVLASFRPCAPSSTSQQKAQLLKRRVEEEKPPLFDFKDRIGEILSQTEDQQDQQDQQLACELLFNEYTDKLRDHYLDVFEDYAQGENAAEKLQGMMTWCENECKVAMSSSIPDLDDDICESWAFDGALGELCADMERLVADRIGMPIPWRANEGGEGHDHREAAAGGGAGTTAKKFMQYQKHVQLPPRAKLALKWAASQSLILLIHFAQGEWSRRSARHVAAKRWADVPGFPML